MESQPSPDDQRRQDGLLITSVVMTVMAGQSNNPNPTGVPNPKMQKTTFSPRTQGLL